MERHRTNERQRNAGAPALGLVRERRRQDLGDEDLRLLAEFVAHGAVTIESVSVAVGEPPGVIPLAVHDLDVIVRVEGDDEVSGLFDLRTDGLRERIDEIQADLVQHMHRLIEQITGGHCAR